MSTQAPTPMANADSNPNFTLPPTRKLPFKSKNKPLARPNGSPSAARETQWAVDGRIEMEKGQKLSQAGMPRPAAANVVPVPHETGQQQRLDTADLPESYGSVKGAAEFRESHRLQPADKPRRRLELPRPPIEDTQMQDAGTSFDGMCVSSRDSELSGIFGVIQDALQQWQRGFPDGRDAGLREILSNLQTTAKRLHAYLHPSRHQRPKDHSNDGKLLTPTVTGENKVAPELAAAMTERHFQTGRRHTREYKQWRNYYLFACRLYETKEERTDPEFIHRFLRGIPGETALRWVQMGLLHCYPSMARLSDRRSGTTLVFTKDLRWSHVCEMVTRKLKLPFPKWETV